MIDAERSLTIIKASIVVSLHRIRRTAVMVPHVIWGFQWQRESLLQSLNQTMFSRPICTKNFMILPSRQELMLSKGLIMNIFRMEL